MKIRIDFPQRYYPKSFLKLLLLAFGVVALPLLLGMLDVAVYVDRLTGQGRTAVVQAAQAARSSRMLMEQVTGLERVVRQYLVLGDAELLGDYDRLRGNFKATTSELSLLPLNEYQLRELNRAIDREQSLYLFLSRAPTAPADRRALIEGYVALSDMARGVLEASNELTDREIEYMRQSAEDARWVLLRHLVATIALGILIAFGVTLLVAQPIRELEQAIRRLGTGKFEGNIQVRGPADLEYLGGRLDWLRGRLEELEQQKRLFLRHVSHELKTPLTALREGSELLAEGAGGRLTQQQGEIVTILQHNSVRLQKLIEDLLDYHRAQEGLTRLDVAPVRLDRVVEQVLDAHKLAAHARGVHAELLLHPLTLNADADKLRVVVDNLVSNAIKYSPKGGTISLSLARHGDGVTLDVSDAGPGIPEEDRDRIFEWFYRGEHSRQGRVRGSGLGLAIAQELVIAHRGRIEVIDDGAQGAHFRVTLPVGGEVHP